MERAIHVQMQSNFRPTFHLFLSLQLLVCVFNQPISILAAAIFHLPTLPQDTLKLNCSKKAEILPIRHNFLHTNSRKTFVREDLPTYYCIQ